MGKVQKALLRKDHETHFRQAGYVACDRFARRRQHRLAIRASRMTIGREPQMVRACQLQLRGARQLFQVAPRVRPPSTP